MTREEAINAEKGAFAAAALTMPYEEWFTLAVARLKAYFAKQGKEHRFLAGDGFGSERSFRTTVAVAYNDHRSKLSSQEQSQQQEKEH
jgi:hypothetical protein